MLYVKEKYKLYLKWDKVEKNRDDLCVVKGAYFCGPVLKSAQQISYPDEITIDLTPQYSSVLSNYYFTSFKWNRLDYKEDRILLFDCYLLGDYINSISNLDNLDYILVDTENHEEEVHMYNLVYKGAVMVKENEEKV